jgi:hypothetical protein
VAYAKIVINSLEHRQRRFIYLSLSSHRQIVLSTDW